MVPAPGCNGGGNGGGDAADDQDLDPVSEDFVSPDGDDPVDDAAEAPGEPADDPVGDMDDAEEGDGDDPGDDASDAVEIEPELDPNLCNDGFPRGEGAMELTEVARFTPAPEGVTVCPGGDVFVSLFAAGEIWRLPVDGSGPVLYTTLEGRGPAGLACDDEGRIFAADFGREGGGPSGCVRIDHEGHEGLSLPNEVGGEAFTEPNGIAFVPGAGIYMSDSKRGLIARFVEDAPDTYSVTLAASGADLIGFLDGAFTGANGLAYRVETRTLYCAVSTMPRLQAYEVALDGSLPETPTTMYEHAAVGHALDGSAVDENGGLYVAKWLRGELLRVSDEEVIATFPNPASLAWRGGTLFMTSYIIGAEEEGSLQSIDIGACGGYP